MMLKATTTLFLPVSFSAACCAKDNSPVALPQHTGSAGNFFLGNS
jgi:hypothetical protein